MTKKGATRRAVLGGLGAGVTGASLLKSQQDPFRDHSRVPGMDELKTAVEFEPVAFAKLPRETYTYTAYGSEGEFTLRRNREAFDWVELLPRGVVDAGSIKTATNVLGTALSFPMMVSPSAAHGALYRDGEMATHQGATAAANTPMIISANASFPVDKIAAAATSPIWWQLYPQQDMDRTKELLDTALAAGAKAIVMTVDQQASYYEHSVHDRHLNAGPLGGGGRGGGGRGGGAAAAAASNPYRVQPGRLWYNWQYADQVRKMLTVPIAVKGVLTGEDAKAFVEHGFDAIYVSNHGGRSLDYDPSTLEVLTEIVDAVPARVPVLFDSGIRNGSDILKALALGAKAVCLGRVIRWGLAAYGPQGVQRILEILQGELVMAMAQTGRTDLASIDRTLVRTHFR
ncbi:MAG TPA: alpha-hydroxy acid oxidase [Bryobacteraceae bacterium]|nr:alpha-hydroxy acid oxidase [Bryobacteraceae bacterium]